MLGATVAPASGPREPPLRDGCPTHGTTRWNADVSEALVITIVATLLAGYALVARRLATTPITGPMVFLTAGIVLGPLVTDSLRGVTAESVRVVVETALVLVLFTDAATFRLRWRRSELELPARLLLIGLPLTVALGAVTATVVLTDISPLGAAALAVILAPTDAALGQAIVSNPLVPARIRNALNIESGLNDGLAVPILSLVIAAAGLEAGGDSLHVIQTFAGALIPAIVVGIVSGAAGGWLLTLARRRGWTSPGWEAVAVIALALLSYAASDAVHASGFVAAFVGGLAFGRATRAELEHTPEAAEGITHLVSLLAFLIVGAAVFDPELALVTAPMVVYAILSLTVVRMLPVAVSMIGSRLRPLTILYLGWSGPRGLATIVFATILLLDVSEPDVKAVVAVAVITSLISVYAHGLTAWPFSARYGRWCGRLEASGAALAEDEPVEQPVVRPRLDPRFALPVATEPGQRTRPPS
jgi:NhaP-type Na+/H+ or K+/H+ antiporter